MHHACLFVVDPGISKKGFLFASSLKIDRFYRRTALEMSCFHHKVDEMVNFGF